MNTTEDLATKIERLVGDHIAEIRRTAAQAVERAFAGTSKPPAPKKQTTSAPARPSRRRRNADQLEAVAERLHAAICERPGETMAVLSERVDATVRELNGPMNILRRAGRIRSVGTRRQTRYFPAVGRAANSRS
jgi:hypothetical protein